MIMLEKMARAMYEHSNAELLRAAREAYGEHGRSLRGWDMADDETKERFRRRVRAALEAAMEPDEGMYKAAMRYLRTDSETNFWAAWQAAIQHILEGK